MKIIQILIIMTFQTIKLYFCHSNIRKQTDIAAVYGPLKKISVSLIGETTYLESQLLQWSTEKRVPYIHVAHTMDRMDDKGLTYLRSKR